MTIFGEIKTIDIRTIWPNEATEFTPWLVENINRLGQALGMEIEVQEREAAVGEFALDILAKDLGTGRTVVIENQLTQTDHDHLGKLLTYAGGLDAGVLVWIAKELRDEHRKALEWLNEHTGPDVDVFGVVIEVIKIDESKPAFNFKPVVFPNEWQKDRGGRRFVASPKGEAYRTYFQNLIDELRTQHKFTGAKIGQPQNWYSFSSGVSDATFGAVFSNNNRVRVEVYLDQGNQEKNKSLYDWLLVRKEEIEKQCGFALEWERLDGKQASRITVSRKGSIESSFDELDVLRKWQVETLLIFKKVFGPLLKEGVNAVYP